MPTYGFRTTKSIEDEELETLLNKMTGKERSDFIRKALHFYVKYENKLNSIESGINEILVKMNTGNSSSIHTNLDTDKEPNNDELVLYNSMQDLLNLQD